MKRDGPGDEKGIDILLVSYGAYRLTKFENLNNQNSTSVDGIGELIKSKSCRFWIVGRRLNCSWIKQKTFSSSVKIQADSFQRQGRQLRRKMWLQNFQIKLIVGGIILALIIIVWLTACG
ncbi:hypothetical protein RJ640_018249, partial [Escallonia rubra]